MRLDNTYRAWPVTIVIFVAIGCLAAPEVARDAIRRQLVATESGIERFTRVIEDAFRLPPIQVEKENANDVPSMSRRRPPRVFRPPAHNVDVAPGLPSLEPEVAPDPVIAADVKPLGTEPDAGMSPWSESIVAVANITDASAEPFPGKGETK
jgi:hypothetical protein